MMLWLPCKVGGVVSDKAAIVSCLLYFWLHRGAMFLHWSISLNMQFARAVFATRATLVAHGNLSNTPRLDHLLAELSLK